MPARIGTFGFARYTSPTLRKTKRANFANDIMTVKIELRSNHELLKKNKHT